MSGRQDPVPVAAASAIRTLHLDTVTAEVVRAFGAAGVPSILLKGPTLSRWLYDDGARPYVDIDLLVPPRARVAAERVLRSLGFGPGAFELIKGDYPRHASVFRRHDGATLDLHRTLVGVGVDDDRVWEELSARTEPMTVGGEEVDVPSPVGRAFVVAIHAAKDGGRVPKVRRDLERALVQVDGETWREAARLAAALGAEAAFGAGLRLVPQGAELARRLGLPMAVTPEIAIRRGGAPPLATGLDWLVATRGVSASRKLRVVVRKVFPPPAYLREWAPLARRGRVGLALAYVWRPVWLARHALPAGRAVLRAHRGASGSGSPPPADAPGGGKVR
jgi:hypothetical protein